MYLFNIFTSSPAFFVTAQIRTEMQIAEAEGRKKQL